MLLNNLSSLAILAAAVIGAPTNEKREPSYFTPGPYKLPELPYSYSALEPVLSTEIMELHHSKHQQAYIDNLNKNIDVDFNGGGFINHSFFWKTLSPIKSHAVILKHSSHLYKAIIKKWGTFESFQAEFKKAGLSVKGSGWVWLVMNKSKHLSISTTPNQDPVVKPYTPIIGVDVWEHGYYLVYKNKRADYLDAMWKIINWKIANDRYDAPVKFRKPGFPFPSEIACVGF